MSGVVDPHALYTALIGDPARLRLSRHLTYRCDVSRCLLLDAIAVPEPANVLLHQLRFKQSPRLNRARSNAAGRKKHTFDGEDHWKAATFYISQSALNFPQDQHAGLPIQCDHVSEKPDGAEVTLSAAQFDEDWKAGHTEVRMRRDGTRFAVC